MYVFEYVYVFGLSSFTLLRPSFLTDSLSPFVSTFLSVSFAEHFITDKQRKSVFVVLFYFIFSSFRVAGVGFCFVSMYV